MLTGELQPVTATKEALQLAKDRVARRLGSGRTALPPDLGGGLFALTTQAGPPNASPQPDGAAQPGPIMSFVGSFGNTSERRANLSFLQPAITARAETLTERMDALFRLHTGSRDRDHDATGMPIQGGAYPNLCALQLKWRALGEMALRVGEISRIDAEADGGTGPSNSLSQTLMQWDLQARQFEADLDSFRPDDPARVAKNRQRWSATQSLGRRLRETVPAAATPAAPNQTTAPLGTAEQRQLAAAQRQLALLDEQAHEAAVTELIDKHPELRTPSDQSLTEGLFREYKHAVAAQRWRQPERAGHVKLIEDLQAPASEFEARRFSRQAADVRAFAEVIRHPGGKVSRRRRRDWLQDSLAQRGFGSRFGLSLPKLDRWMQQHFTALSLLALRKGRTYLRERIDSMSSLPPLTALNFRDVEAHLAVLAQAYDEAGECLLEAARHGNYALQRAQRATSADEKTRTQPCLVAQGCDFRSSFPLPLRGTREDKPDPTIADATWIAVLHEVWTADLLHAQREIRSNTTAIEHPVNPKTGRKLSRLKPHTERYYRDRLCSAKRTIERILVDYRGRFGIEAARRFSDHLEWLHVPAVRDLPMNALTPEEAADRARILEWADRYIQMWLYQPAPSKETSPEAKPGRTVATDPDAATRRMYDEARSEQAAAEREYQESHGVQALAQVLRQVRDGLVLRGCKVLPDLPDQEPTLEAVASAETHGGVSGKPSPAGATHAVEQALAAIDPPGSPSVAPSTAVTNDAPTDELCWSTAIPNREGLTQYTLLIRAPGDECFEKRRRGAKVGGQLAWRASMSPATVEDWSKRIRLVLADGIPRTFNRLVLEASEGKFTADIAAGKAPETALWLLLPKGELEWANHPDGYVIWRATHASGPREAQTAVAHNGPTASMASATRPNTKPVPRALHSTQLRR